MDVTVTPAPLEACASSGRFLQSDFWASFKAEFGWKPRAFILGLKGEGLPLLVLERRVKGILSFAYVPHGPDLGPVLNQEALDPAFGAQVLGGLAQGLKPHLNPANLFLRFDPPWGLAEAGAPESIEGTEVPEVPEAEAGPPPPAGQKRQVVRPLVGLPLRRASADVQPPDTVILDLGAGEEDLLQGMKPKWRYNIRLAQKKDVTVASVGAQEGEAAWGPALDEFYALYEETSVRDHIALHPKAYYRRLFELAATRPRPAQGQAPELRLWRASHGGQTLAAIITVFWGKEAIYLYGASSSEKRNLMPTYLLQWEAIRAAKAHDCTYYDFFGMSPTGDDPSHPMAGLYRFKTGFGGARLHRPGSWDYPLKALPYFAYRGAEAARAWYFKDFRKRGVARS